MVRVLNKTGMGVGLMLVGACAMADDCPERTATAMQDLQVIVPGMDESQVSAAQNILTGLCDPVTEDAGIGSSDAPRPANPGVDAESSTLLGIEFERADEDAKGHSRLKKRH
jgi:hypothetical protein